MAPKLRDLNAVVRLPINSSRRATAWFPMVLAAELALVAPERMIREFICATIALTTMPTEEYDDVLRSKIYRPTFISIQ